MHADLSLQRRNAWVGEIQPLPMLVVSAAALLVLGVIMISSASMDMAAETVGSSYYYVIRQLIFAALGCLLGLVVCWLQSRFDLISIPSDIYIINSLPVDMRATDFVLVSAVSLVICLLASVYPARKAASLQPVEAIRYIA